MMNDDLLSRLDAKRINVKSRRRRVGIGTVISSVIMVAAVAILGSVVLIWANSSLNVERTRIGNDYTTNSNLLQENFIVEDIWLEGPPVPQNYVNITIRNLGTINVNITSVKITALNDTGLAACTFSCESGTSYEKTLTSIPNKGVIDSKTTLRIDVGGIDWDHINSKSLDITITTSRGSEQEIFWKVK